MRRARLAELVERYRWLWRAQRRWHPSSTGWAVIQFVGRIVADAVWFLLSAGFGGGSMARNPIRGMTWAVAGLTLMVASWIAVERFQEDSDAQASSIQWASAVGGFDVVFPNGWEPATDTPPSFPSGVFLEGSAHRLHAGGVLRGRYLDARAYQLAEMEPGTTMYAAARSAQSPPDDSYHNVWSPSRTGSGAYVAARRFERSGRALSQAQIVLRGRNANTFLIEVTGDRVDEPVLLTQARAIADSIRLDARPLYDAEIFLFAYLDVPNEAAEGARYVQPSVADSAVSGSRLLVMATLDEAPSIEACRAGSAQMWLGVLGPFLVERFRRRLWSHQLQLSCPGSSVELLYDLRGHDFFLRQYDATGTLVYEKDLTSVVYRPEWGGNSIS
ncbi:MAG: hypothetical protein AB7T31_06340 [Gemmatimonadales bacterium]